VRAISAPRDADRCRPHRRFPAGPSARTGRPARPRQAWGEGRGQARRRWSRSAWIPVSRKGSQGPVFIVAERVGDPRGSTQSWGRRPGSSWAAACVEMDDPVRAVIHAARESATVWMPLSRSGAGGPAAAASPLRLSAKARSGRTSCSPARRTVLYSAQLVQAGELKAARW